MITLLTGVPGTGKTAYAVKMLMDAKGIEDRPIYTNITDLKLPHFQIDAEWIRNWPRNAPPGAFILFDECQDVFPPRHVSREAPDYVSELTKHRKDYSVDFFLITQGSSLIDYSVKALVERHLHIRLDGLVPMIHEAREVVDFKEKAARETHPGSPYKPPKEAFDQYTSAQVHNKKPRRKMPPALYVFAFAGMLAVGLAWYVYQNRISPAFDQAKNAGEVEQGGGLPPPVHSPEFSTLPAVPKRLVEALTPTDDHNPLSAPLYAAVVPPVVAPEVQGCIASQTACKCYSQQQTPIWLPDEQCRQRAAGLYYDSYRQPMQPDARETKPPTAAMASVPTKEAPPAQASETPFAML